MIIHKNPISVEIGTVIPENNQGYENVFIIEDTSELGEKVIKYMPYFNFVLDEKGKLVDITPTEKPPQPPQPPTEFEQLSNYVLDVDFRVVMLEMGL